MPHTQYQSPPYSISVLIPSLCTMMLCFNTANAVEQDSVNYSSRVLQSISIGGANNPVQSVIGQTMHVEWTVTSNNAFSYSFKGESMDDDGNIVNIPQLVKKEVNADGEIIDGQFETLPTTAGLLVHDYESIQTSDTWGEGANAVGDLYDLVKNSNEDGAPYQSTGRIMTGDDTSTAKVLLYLKGDSDMYDQSGLYDAEVTITVVADEQLT